MGRRNFFEDTSGVGPEAVPDARLDEAGLAGLKRLGHPSYVGAECAMQDLKSFFLALVKVCRMSLVRQLNDNFFAVFPIDAINDHGAKFSEIADSVMV